MHDCLKSRKINHISLYQWVKQYTNTLKLVKSRLRHMTEEQTDLIVSVDLSNSDLQWGLFVLTWCRISPNFCCTLHIDYVIHITVLGKNSILRFRLFATLIEINYQMTGTKIIKLFNNSLVLHHLIWPLFYTYEYL